MSSTHSITQSLLASDVTVPTAFLGLLEHPSLLYVGLLHDGHDVARRAGRSAAQLILVSFRLSVQWQTVAV